MKRLSPLTRTLALAAMAFAIAGTAQAVVFDSGGDGSDWNDPANWTTDMLPGSGTDPEAAIIGDATETNPATVNLAAAPGIQQIGDLRVGNGSGGTGTFNHSSGQIAPRPDKWSFVGADGNGLAPSIGEYNMSGDASYTLWNAETGPFNSNEGNFFLGIGGGRRDFDDPLNSARNEGTLNVTDTATLVAGNLFVGNNDDNRGTVNQDSGTVVAENWISIGRETGAIGEYNMSGGQLAVSNDGITVGESTGATGTLNLSGDAVVDAPRMRVGRSLGTSPEDGGGVGYLNVTGADVDLTVGFLDVGANDGVLTDGEGTLKFVYDGGFSTLEVLTDVLLNDGSGDGFAALEIDTMGATLPTSEIELIDIGGTLSGMFMGLPEGATVGTTGRTISYVGGDGNDIVLEAIGGTMLLGDADGDGDVDGDDLIAVQTEFGATGPSPLLGDADGDGDVDGDDLIAVQTEFGATAPSAAIPEPTTLGLLLATGIGFMARGRNG